MSAAQSGHNTPLANAEFRVAFTETNLRWVLSDMPRDEAKIQRIQAQLDEARAELSALQARSDA